jgi:hypothetical protein
MITISISIASLKPVTLQKMLSKEKTGKKKARNKGLMDVESYKSRRVASATQPLCARNNHETLS